MFRRVAMSAALIGALVGCGEAERGLMYPGPQPVVEEPSCEHVTDGRFTPGCDEWPERTRAVEGPVEVYADYADGVLHLLVRGGAPVTRAWLVVSQGKDRFVVLPDGRVLVDEQPVGSTVPTAGEGGVLELAIQLAPTDIVLALDGPGVVLAGYLSTMGAEVSPTDAPVILAMTPGWGLPGVEVEVVGRNLRGPAHVTVGDQPVELTAASEDAARFQIPQTDVAALQPVRVFTDFGPTNPLLLNVGACPVPVIDGAFTPVTEAGACEEWPDTVSYGGSFGDLHVQVRDGLLYVLNDWHLRDDLPIDPSWYNLFQLTTGSGTESWQIKVFGDQTMEVVLNGDVVDHKLLDGAAGSGFHASPNNAKPHSIFEFRLAVSPGDFSMALSDPKNGDWETPEDALQDEPTVFVGALEWDGVPLIVTTGRPQLLAVSPSPAHVGDSLTISAHGLPPAEGTVRIGGQDATVESWSEDTIIAVVPDVVGHVFVRVFSEYGAGNTLPLVVHPIGTDPCGDGCGEGLVCVPSGACCAPDCAGITCGPDGCGGSCGVCPAQDQCVGGECECVPSCVGKACGDDGCGGSCGVCPSADVCVASKCVCPADCAGKACGPNGCGGLCGACPAFHLCQDGACVCLPSCAGKVCGPDGCGGSCGTCAAGEGCVGGACECAPSCDAKACGDDGCGGTCGTCPAGSTCSKIGMCTAS